jgi:arylsulfatase A-like enzyme
MLLSLLAIGLASSQPSIQPERPNVVFILADDIGYGDLSCYGATKVKTPNLDSIAKNGVRFTDAHSAATVCTPTRYSLMTGEYSFRKPGGAGILSGVAPSAIAKDQPTMPKMFQAAGYRTGVVGKWHLGLGEGRTDYNKLITLGPKEVGFDESFVIPATGDRVPCVFVENGRVAGYDPADPIELNYQKKIGDEPAGLERPELLKIKPVQGHLGTVINGVSRIGFMTGGKKARWVDEDIADTLTSKAVGFIKSNKSKPFFLYLATHDVHAPLLPNPRFNGKSQCGLRGDTISELDWTVGEVLKALKDAKVDKNTIVIFSSDNGAVDQDGYEDPRENLNGHKVNGALRGTKYELYEGGHRVPLLVSWPAQTARGKTSAAMVTQTDFFASFGKILGANLPPGASLDSRDTSEAFFKLGRNGRDSVVHHLGGYNSPLAYREGDFVLVPKGKGWELFNLAKDLGQKTDLAASMPEKVEAMKAKLYAIAPPKA